MNNGEHALVPPGWTACRLGDILTLEYGKSLPAQARHEFGSVPVFGSSGVVGAHSVGFVTGPCIIVGRKGTAGSVHFSKENCWPIDTTYYVSSNSELNIRYIYFLLRSLRLAQLDRSTAIPGLNRDDAYAKAIKLPPLNEQLRIVDRIEMLFAQLDKGEEALRAVQKQLTRYRQSILKAAVTGQLTADWRAENAHRLEHGRDLLARILQTRREAWDGRGKYKEPLEPDTTDLPELPTGWVWASVDQIAVHFTSGSRDWKRYYGRGRGIFIMAQNVRPMRFDLTKKFLVDPPLDSPDAKRSEARLDDILITIVGANTGDTCRFDRPDQRHFVCQSVALLRLAEPEWARFVELHLNGKGAGRDQIERYIYGAGRPHLSFEQLRTLAVPVLSGEERDEIVDRVSAIMARIELLERLCREQLARSSALRQSVLKDAFAGRLVPQDPADEPAAELLARMKDVARSASTRRRRSRA